MEVKQNEVTGHMEAHLDGTVEKISTNVLKNMNDTEYHLADVSVKYPNGDDDTFTASVWKKSVDQGIIKENMRASVVIQLTADDERYIGNAKVQLPDAKKADVSKLGVNLEELAQAVQNDG